MGLEGMRVNFEDGFSTRISGRYDVGIPIAKWVQKEENNADVYPYSHGGVVGRRA
jgi:hypothetical protein